MAISRQIRAKKEGFDSEGDRDKTLEILSRLSEDLMSLSPTEFKIRFFDYLLDSIPPVPSASTVDLAYLTQMNRYNQSLAAGC